MVYWPLLFPTTDEEILAVYEASICEKKDSKLALQCLQISLQFDYF